MTTSQQAMKAAVSKCRRIRSRRGRARCVGYVVNKIMSGGSLAGRRRHRRRR